jgi:hypothetical protein
MGLCFEIRAGRLVEGITLDHGQIHVGESGRGRSLTIVPLPPGATVDAGRLLAVPQAATVLLIRDQSGYRGSWHLAEFATHRCTLDGHMPPGQPHRLDGHVTCPDCGTDFCACSSQYRHPAAPARPIPPETIGTVLARGERAQGTAGRMGGGPEYLLAVQPGARFSLRRSGRLYGGPHRLNVEIAEDGTPVLTDAWATITTTEAADAWATI